MMREIGGERYAERRLVAAVLSIARRFVDCKAVCHVEVWMSIRCVDSCSGNALKLKCQSSKFGLIE